MALAPTADQRTASAAADKAGTEVKWNGPAPLSIRGKGLGQRQAFSGGKGLAVQAAAKVEQKAVAVLDNLSRFYGFKDVEQEL